MHQHTRRKKKRINYGVRTVELVRGAKGYGFTISGQQPCILSCIVPGSPAEFAGLRSGDYLIAVNGHGVGRVPHDEVVGLIAHASGALRLQIAENYYSDSSDEGSSSAVRTKPKHRSKSSNSSGNDAIVEVAGSSHPQCRVAKVVRDLQSGAMFDTSSRFGLLPYRWNMLTPPPPPSFRKSDSEKVVHRTIVGYLGTIDIPTKLYPTSMSSILRKCIKKLKAEKRAPTTVALTIHVANIKLTNCEGQVVAEYPSHRIVYCSPYTEEEMLYFGILTKAAINNEEELVPDSCHVFIIYSKMTDHEDHSSTCNTFGFSCTRTSELDSCQEFPQNCDSLIGAIQTLYITDSVEGDGTLFDSRKQREASSPQLSNVSSSTAHSSNSDSGIGFKDDYRSLSDRHYNAEFPPSPQEMNVAVPTFGVNVMDPIGSRLTVRATSDLRWSDYSGCRSTASNFDDHTSSFEDNDKSEDKSAECRTDRVSSEIPNDIADSTGAHGPTLVDRNVSNTSCASRLSVQSVNRVSPLASSCSGEVVGLSSKFDSVETYYSTMTADCGVVDKLSPKVYTGRMRPQVHSMENLKSPTRPDDYPGSMIDLLSHRDEDSARDKSYRGWGSLQEIRKEKRLSCNVESCNKNGGIGVHNWASSFEKLLEDPKGLQTFAEFLKKEFSHENIYFWAACERYADTDDVSARQQLAQQIYLRYLSSDAAEPVNVDSHAAGQITQERLYAASSDLFFQAQKQVFNLMKFDSYPRFLRSDLYQRCLETGSGIITSGNEELHLTSSPSIKLKKSLSDAEDRCRKSILPWYRKNRSKSKDRGETEYNKVPVRGETIYKSFTMVKRDTEKDEEDSTSISSSRSSLASWDIALRQSFTKHSTSSCEGQSNEKREVQVAKCTGLCRVILPDGSTTVVPTSQLESVRDVVTRLLDKRALRYLTYEVVVLATDEIVGLKCPSSVLASQEVEVVPTKTLKVDLPSRRVITVVARRGSTLKEVLKPLLNKYGLKLEFVTVWAGGHPVSIDILATNAPSRLTLTTSDEDIFVGPPSRASSADIPKGQPTLDEITNKVFEELLVGKSSGKHSFGEYSSKSEDQRSDCSSSNSSKFFSRDSTLNLRKKAKSKSIRELGNHSDSTETSHSQPPLIAKWRNGVRLQLPSRCDDLYEGLKRAQRSRLEDQRGTEINFELPDFLKGNKVTDSKKLRKQRAASANCETSKFYDSTDDKISDRGSDSSENLDNTVVDKDKTIVETDFCQEKVSSKQTTSTPMKPPPLPPKPKSLSNTLKNNVLLTRPFQRIVHYDKKSI